MDGSGPASRNDRDVIGSYPELRTLLGRFPRRPLILDGEIVALDQQGRPSFSLVQQRMHVRAPAAGLLTRVLVQLYVFDVLHLGGSSTVDLAYTRRRGMLDDLGLDDDVTETPPFWTDDAGKDLMRSAGELGLEGVVAKRLESRYQPGARSHWWIKTPLNRTVEVVIARRPDSRCVAGSLVMPTMRNVPHSGATIKPRIHRVVNTSHAVNADPADVTHRQRRRHNGQHRDVRRARHPQPVGGDPADRERHAGMEPTSCTVPPSNGFRGLGLNGRAERPRFLADRHARCVNDVSRADRERMVGSRAIDNGGWIGRSPERDAHFVAPSGCWQGHLGTQVLPGGDVGLWPPYRCRVSVVCGADRIIFEVGG